MRERRKKIRSINEKRTQKEQDTDGQNRKVCQVPKLRTIQPIQETDKSRTGKSVWKKRQADRRVDRQTVENKGKAAWKKNRDEKNTGEWRKKRNRRKEREK